MASGRTIQKRTEWNSLFCSSLFRVLVTTLLSVFFCCDPLVVNHFSVTIMELSTHLYAVFTFPFSPVGLLPSRPQSLDGPVPHDGPGVPPASSHRHDAKPAVRPTNGLLPAATAPAATAAHARVPAGHAATASPSPRRTPAQPAAVSHGDPSSHDALPPASRSSAARSHLPPGGKGTHGAGSHGRGGFPRTTRIIHSGDEPRSAAILSPAGRHP